MNGGDDTGRPADTEAPGEYCRHVEAYLCRKNDGHLVRIAGPAFTRVCGWATQGIPLTVVYRGIDRYFERYYSRGPRRRPVQIDFCENDVLDVFDEWRRAVGVWVAPEPVDSSSRRRTSLPAHLERVIVRLTTMRAGGRLTAQADAALDGTVRELDAARAQAVHLRGTARDALLSRLRVIDLDLVTAVRSSIDASEWQAIERAARDELASFRSGMAEEAYQRAVEASAIRLLRERFGLPVLEYEE